MQLEQVQKAFIAAAVGRRIEQPNPWLHEGGGSLAGLSGISIYRNNMIMLGLSTLCDDFPISYDVLGEDIFTEVARSFVLSDAARRSSLVHMGRGFSSYVSNSAYAVTYPCLPDLMRFEWALCCAERSPLMKNAVDMPSIIDPERLMLSLCPESTLLYSRYPVHRIWQQCQSGHVLAEDVWFLQESVYLWIGCQDADVVYQEIDQDMWHGLQLLQHDIALSDLYDALAKLDLSENLSKWLSYWFSQNMLKIYVKEDKERCA